MLKVHLTITLLWLFSVAGYAQSDNAQQVADSQRFFNTFLSLEKYLRLHKTPVISLQKSGKSEYLIGEAFYDTVVNRFFNPVLMRKYLGADTNFFSLKEKLDINRYLLHQLDKGLDSLPSGYYQLELNKENAYVEEVELHGCIVNIYCYVNGVKTIKGMVSFDRKTARCINVFPYATTEKPAKE